MTATSGIPRGPSRPLATTPSARRDTAQRGSAYSEKARYCRAFKLISADEYGRLFGLAVKDHDQAIVLDPGSAEAYFSRGQTYYDRAALEDPKDAKPWFELGSRRFQESRRERRPALLGIGQARPGSSCRPASWTWPSAISRKRWRSIRWAGRGWRTPTACAGPLIRKRRSTMPPSRITRRRSRSASPPTAARAIL